MRWFQCPRAGADRDPTGWTYFDKELGGVVQTLAVLNGTVFVGGFGFTASGLNSSCIAQWDGTTWKPVGEGLQEDVSALVNVMTVNAGELYVGGSFTSAGNLKVNNICKWDGVRWSALGEGISGNSVVGAPQVKALHFADGTLYVGGEFGRAGFRNTAGIAMWRNGQWSELGSGVGWTGNFPPRRQYVTAITSYDGAIYVGGWFNRAGGATANQVARWDGISWSGIGSGLERIEPGVNSMAIFGSDLFVAGNLTRIGGKDSAYLAKALLGVTAVSLQVLPDGRIASLFRGMPGKQYHLQRATRLDSLVDWETVTAVPLTAGGDGTLSFVDPTPLAISAFYRAQRP
jgi:trimeric autotransporter adhesin